MLCRVAAPCCLSLTVWAIGGLLPAPPPHCPPTPPLPPTPNAGILHAPGERKVRFFDIATDASSLAEHQAMPSVDMRAAPFDAGLADPACGA